MSIYWRVFKMCLGTGPFQVGETSVCHQIQPDWSEKNSANRLQKPLPQQICEELLNSPATLRHRWHSDITSCIVPKISQVPCWTPGRDPWKLKPTARNMTRWCLQRASTTCPRKAEHQQQGRSRLDITRQQVGSTWHCDPSWPSHAGGPPWALPPAASVEPTFGTWKLRQQFLCQVPYPSAINPGVKQLRWSWKFENKWGHSFHTTFATETSKSAVHLPVYRAIRQDFNELVVHHCALSSRSPTRTSTITLNNLSGLSGTSLCAIWLSVKPSVQHLSPQTSTPWRLNG